MSQASSLGGWGRASEGAGGCSRTWRRTFPSSNEEQRAYSGIEADLSRKPGEFRLVQLPDSSASVFPHLRHGSVIAEIYL